MAFEWRKSAQPFSRNALDRQTDGQTDDGRFSFEFPPQGSFDKNNNPGAAFARQVPETFGLVGIFLLQMGKKNGTNERKKSNQMCEKGEEQSFI